MSLKKDLKSLKGQAVLEYILIFTVVVSTIFVIFGGFSPGNQLIQPAFNGAIDRAVEYINRSR